MLGLGTLSRWNPSNVIKCTKTISLVVGEFIVICLKLYTALNDGELSFDCLKKLVTKHCTEIHSVNIIQIKIINFVFVPTALKRLILV